MCSSFFSSATQFVTALVSPSCLLCNWLCLRWINLKPSPVISSRCCICSGRSPPVLWVWPRVSVPGAEDVSCCERGHDAAPGHGWPSGKVTLCSLLSSFRRSSFISDTLCTQWLCPPSSWSGSSAQLTISGSRQLEMSESPSTSSSCPHFSSLKLL